MIYRIFAPLLAPYYGVLRRLMSLGSKVFFAYGGLIALMAYAGDRGLASLPVYGKWLVYAVALRVLIIMGDDLMRRLRCAMTPKR